LVEGGPRNGERGTGNGEGAGHGRTAPQPHRDTRGATCEVRVRVSVGLTARFRNGKGRGGRWFPHTLPAPSNHQPKGPAQGPRNRTAPLITHCRARTQHRKLSHARAWITPPGQ